MAIVILAALAIAGAFLYGRRIRPESRELADNKAQLDTNWTDVTGAASFRAAAAQRTVEAEEVRTPLKRKRAELRAAVSLVGDSAVSIDGGVPLLVPPALIGLVGIDDELVHADSAAIGALTLENIAIAIERDAWRDRAQLLEQRVQILERQRCGTGCKVGGTLLVLGALALVL